MRILFKSYILGLATGMGAAIAFLAGLLHYQRKQALKTLPENYFSTMMRHLREEEEKKAHD